MNTVKENKSGLSRVRMLINKCPWTLKRKVRTLEMTRVFMVD